MLNKNNKIKKKVGPCTLMVTFMKENIIASNLLRKIIVNLKLINHKKKILFKKNKMYYQKRWNGPCHDKDELFITK